MQVQILLCAQLGIYWMVELVDAPGIRAVGEIHTHLAGSIPALVAKVTLKTEPQP